MSFHGRAPKRIQDAMYALVPRDNRKMYSPVEVGVDGTSIYGDRSLYMNTALPGKGANTAEATMDKYVNAVMAGNRELHNERVRKLYSPTEQGADGTSIYGDRARYNYFPEDRYQFSDLGPIRNQPNYQPYRSPTPSTEGNVPINSKSENYSPTYKTFQPTNVFDDPGVDRRSSPSTAGNAPANKPYQRALPRGVDPATQATVDVNALPPAAAGENAMRIAKSLINDKLRAGGAIAAGIGGAGLVGMGINGIQGDSEQSVNPMAQAALLGGMGAGLSAAGVDQFRGQNNYTARGFEQPSSFSRDERHRVSKARGAYAGMAGGLASSLLINLNNANQQAPY
jgi:hypothetical protein